MVSTSFLASEYLSAPNVSFKLFWRRKEREHSVLASHGGRGTPTDLTGANSSSSEPNSSFPCKPPRKPKSTCEIGFCSGPSSPNRTAHSPSESSPTPWGQWQGAPRARGPLALSPDMPGSRPATESFSAWTNGTLGRRRYRRSLPGASGEEVQSAEEELSAQPHVC